MKLFRFAPLLIPALAALLYINTLDNPFVVDDIPYIVENYQIRHISKILSSFRLPYPPDSPSQGLYRPLTNISFGVDYFFWKLDPRGYHLSNMILHALASFGFFFLAKSLAGPGAAPWAAALIFAAHPVHTEAVAWVVGRAEVLAALFYFLAFQLYLKARSKGKRLQAVVLSLSAMAFLGAMLSKEIAVSLPLAIFLYEWIRPGGGPARAVRGFKGLYIPYVAVLIIYMVLKMLAVGRLGPESAQQPLLGLSPFFKALLVGRVFLHYVGLLIFPWQLSVDYSLDLSAGSMATYAASFAGLLILALLAAAPFKGRAGYRAGLGFMGLWFFASLLPVLNIFPIGAVLAERFLYLPLAPFALGCALAVGKTENWAGGLRLKSKWGVLALFAVVLAFYSAMTLQRNGDWASEERLWAETARVNPASFKAKNGLGSAYMREELYDKAMAGFAEALGLKANYAAAHNNTGVIYEKKGLADRAIFKYKVALSKDGRYSIARINAGGVYFAKGLYGRAESEYKKVLLDSPNDPVAHKNLGVLYLYKLGYPSLAQRHLKLSLSADPDQADAAAIRRVLASQGGSGPAGSEKAPGGLNQVK